MEPFTDLSISCHITSVQRKLYFSTTTGVPTSQRYTSQPWRVLPLRPFKEARKVEFTRGIGTTLNIKLKTESHLNTIKDLCTSPQAYPPTLLSPSQPSSAWFSDRSQESDGPRSKSSSSQGTGRVPP